jgi:hypothetical protein
VVLRRRFLQSAIPIFLSREPMFSLKAGWDNQQSPHWIKIKNQATGKRKEDWVFSNGRGEMAGGSSESLYMTTGQ